MKSSSNIIRPGQQNAPQTWQPAVLLDSPQPLNQWTVVDSGNCPAVPELQPVQPDPASLLPRGGKTIVAWVPGELAAMGRTRLDRVQPVKPAFMEAEASQSAQALMAEAEETAAAMLAQAQAQRSEILLQAQRAADEMIAEARQEIETAQKMAYQLGQEAAQADAANYLKAANAVVEEVHAWQVTLVQQSTPALLAIARDIAEKMFGEGAVLDNHALQQNLNRLLTNAKILGDINIYLNPQDALTLDSGWREIRSRIAGNRIQIVPSETITRGGCFIEGQMGTVDARVETQLNAVLETLSPNQPTMESAE
jgi:flagellar assembly protein FliH